MHPKNAEKQPPNVTAYDGTSASKTLGAFVSDFQSLVESVQQNGCGLEARLESWYRFLVQPNP